MNTRQPDPSDSTLSIPSEVSLPPKAIYVLGTSHIAKDSVAAIERVMKSHMPSAVCVELDKQRFHGMRSQTKTRFSFSLIRRVGVGGFLFALIGGAVQRWLGKAVGLDPGADMMAGAKLGHASGAMVYLIDRPIEITLRRLSSAMSWRDGWRMFIDTIGGLLWRKRMAREIGVAHLDLSKTPSQIVVRRIVAYMDKRYPKIAHALLHERDQYMTTQIIHVATRHPDGVLLVIVGAAHVGGIVSHLQKQFKDIVREYPIP